MSLKADHNNTGPTHRDSLCDKNKEAQSCFSSRLQLLISRREQPELRGPRLYLAEFTTMVSS